MNINIFINRPLLSIVISVFSVIVGTIALLNLPVEKYPDIAPPTIEVEAIYTGASSETILNSVIIPLEEAINGVEDMIYMTSSASNSGYAMITVYFKQGTNADMAAVNVQNRIATAAGSLPSEVTRIGVTATKKQPGVLRVFALNSPNNEYDEKFLGNYIENIIKPELLRIQGVGGVQVFSGKYSLRIWMKPDIMAQYKLNPSVITTLLAEQNTEAPIGSVGENANTVFEYTSTYYGRTKEINDCKNLIIRKPHDGE